MKILSSLSALLATSLTLTAADYTVLIKKSTYEKPAWRAVAEALVKKHDAKIVQWETNLEEALPAWSKQMPRYTCLVAEVPDAGKATVIQMHQLSRQLDEDIYGDTIWGIITGAEASTALRLAQATEPQRVSDALLSAGVGPERFREAYYVSEHAKGDVGHKKPDGTITKSKIDGDTTPYYVDAFNKLDPDVVLSSAHASERNLEMPFSNGNIVPRDGRLYGLVTGGKRMIGADGQALNIKLDGDLLEMKTPQRPKLYFAVGNCLIGHIPDNNCMALAWLGWGKANQMIGYVVTTWYGEQGWGTLKAWEQSGGKAPINECFALANQKMLYTLEEEMMELPNFTFDPNTDLDTSKLFGQIHPIYQALPSYERATVRHHVGMLWDRDVVAFYGDPALEIRLDEKHTLQARRDIKFVERGPGEFSVVLTVHEAYGKPQLNDAPLGLFFPKRLKNIQLAEASPYKPLLTDNFLLVTQPGPFAAGDVIEFKFTAEEWEAK